MLLVAPLEADSLAPLVPGLSGIEDTLLEGTLSYASFTSWLFVVVPAKVPE